MTRQKNPFPPVALTIAGSDCSGGAGLEADLKTFHAHGVYGMAVVTCVVAESPRRVVSIHPLPLRSLQEQLDCCLDGMPPLPVKTGMLYSSALIHTTQSQIAHHHQRVSYLVMDPVMIATSGKPLLHKNAIRSLKDLIAGYADLVTPNLDEAEILAERKIRTEGHMEEAAPMIAQRFHCSVLMKGGHLHDPHGASDFFWHENKGFWLRAKRIRVVKTHGTGCTYSAAITACLARGDSMETAVKRAKTFITRAIARSYCFGPWTALNHQT